jgi:hypothetical protein
MKKLMFLTLFLGLTCTVNAVESQDASIDTDLEMRHHSHKHHNKSKHCHRRTGHSGPTGAVFGDVAWAYSLGTGPSGGYPFVDTSLSSNEYFVLENQFPSSDIKFSALTSPNSGTMVTFQNAGLYFVEFAVTGEVDSTAFPMVIGAFQGTFGTVPDTLPKGNLFYAFNQDGQLTEFLVVSADANDTLALGNANSNGTLVLEQITYTPTSGPTSVSTTASISIIRIQ